jgi:valine--pyruvate aminotransferase
MKLSRFGRKFTQESGILTLMDDLGEALARGERMLMLGGGNPARIPEVEAVFTERMRDMIGESGEFRDLIGGYDAPQGNRRFIEALVRLFRERYGWDLGVENVALTNGSQTSFFMLFNLLAGEQEDGAHKKILLPLTPEYIGYADSGLVPEFFVSNRPEIELLGDDLFKYHVDFGAVEVTDDIAAICLSRPTNPTSNVLTENELARLDSLARANDVPLIIDNAYGTPFPNIIFTDAEPIWNENVVLTMSLSKLGLPGARTGIVIARKEMISAIAGLNAIVSLAPGSFGAYLARELVSSGAILDLSRKLIRPFYEKKSARTLGWIRESLSGTPYRVHKPEGTFFFWLWLDGMRLTSRELYERLKHRGVLVVPGHYFFPGLDEDWRHKHECIRVNYSQNEETVRKGIEIIGEEIKKAF